MQQKQEENLEINSQENLEKTQQKKEKFGFFKKLAQGLSKTRENIATAFDTVFAMTKIDDEFFEELEEALIVADVGAQTTQKIIEELKKSVKKDKLKEPQQAKEKLIEIIAQMMSASAPFLENLGEKKAVILVVGVNGVGKTTTIGKMANIYVTKGKKVILAAADTFRAAAAEQLCVWGERSKVNVIKHGEGADPAAVVFDAINSAKAKNADVLICDTAGRLHNKKNLMEELRKIGKVIAREWGEAQIEVLLVLDSTTGQNAIAQAKVFAETVDLTGIVLTKLDGTAKGGVVVAVKAELGIPVRFVGVGEAIDDLQEFDAFEFSKAIF